MNISLVILLLAFILVILGYATSNSFFTLAGGFLILLSGLLFISSPILVDSGVIINETSSGVYEVTKTYDDSSGLLTYSFNLVLLLLGMVFMYDSYIKMREDRYAEQEE